MPIERRTRLAVGMWWHPARPARDPVDEIPPRRWGNEPRALTTGQERIEYTPHRRHHTGDFGRTATPVGTVVEHANPPERKRRNNLLYATRIA